MIEETKNKKSKKVESPIGEELSPEKNSPKKRKKDSDSAGDLLKYLKSTFPIINTLIKDFSKINSTDNLKINKKLEKFEKNIESLNKNISSIKKDFEKTNAKIDSIIPTISSMDKTLLAANEQRELSLDLAEERDLENKKEQAYIEEERAETQEDQNAEIISKLGTIDDTLNNLDISGGKSGKGLLDFLKDFATGLLPSIFGGLSAMVGSLASVAGAIFSSPIFLALASAALGAGVGYMLWKTWLEPLMEKEFEEKIKARSQEVSFVTEQSTDEEGKKLFVETDPSGTTRILSESQLAERAGKEGKTTEDYVNEQMDQGTLRKLTYKKDFTGKIIEGQEKYSTEEQQQKTQEIVAKAASAQEEFDQRSMGQIVKDMFKDKDFSKMSEEEKEQYRKQAVSNYVAVTGKNLTAEQISSLENQFKSFMDDPESLNVSMEISQRQTRLNSIENLKEDIEGMHTRLVSALSADYKSEEEATNGVETAKGLAVSMGKKLHPARAKETIKTKRYEGLTVSDIKTVYNNYPLLDMLDNDRNVLSRTFQSGDKTVIKDITRGFLAGYKPKEINGKWIIGTETGMWPFSHKDVSFSDNKEVNTTFPAQIFDSLKNIPKLETGGVVIPKTELGVFTNISENMKPEAVVPLDKYVIQTKEQYSAEKTKNAEAYNVGDDITNIIRSSYFEEKDSNVQQQPIIVNNVNNNKQMAGSVGDPTNFGFQSNMAKTFDNIFDLILEKNMKMGIN